MIGLVNEQGGKGPMAWKSKLIKRIIKSTIDAEAISLGEALEMAYF